MAFADLAFGQGLAGFLRQVEQPEGVGHAHPALAHPFRDLFVGQGKAFGQLVIGFRRLQWGEVGALDILDQSEFQLVLLVDMAGDRRDELEAGQAGRQQAAFTCDQNVVI